MAEFWSQLVVHLDGTVTPGRIPPQYLRIFYDGDTATLTLALANPFLPNQADNLAGFTVKFSASNTGADAHSTFSGTLTPSPSEGTVPFSGSAPHRQQYLVTAAEVKAVSTAYNVSMNDATCDTLARALGEFPPFLRRLPHSRGWKRGH